MSDVAVDQPKIGLLSKTGRQHTYVACCYMNNFCPVPDLVNVLHNILEYLCLIVDLRDTVIDISVQSHAIGEYSVGKIFSATDFLHRHFKS